MSVPVVGDWVSPSWSGHPYYGQTGQILEIGPNGSFRIDSDGDGTPNFYLAANEASNVSGSYTHLGMISDHSDDLVDNAIPVFNTVVTVVLAVLAIGVFTNIVKRIKAR